MTTPKESKTPIGQQAAVERVARATAAIDESFKLSPERARKELEERARALARPVVGEQIGEDVLEVTTFALGAERYAIESRYICEVQGLPELTPCPGTPEFVAGLMNLRGELLLVVDLAKFFALPEQDVSQHSRILVLGTERIEFGVLADTVFDVETLSAEELKNYSASLGDREQEYIRAVTKNALILLDGDALLNDPRLFIRNAERSKQ